MSSIKVDANIMKADVSFSKSVFERIRLMNQLRGMVTLCGTPPCEITLRAMINSPESLSARSHSGVRSVYVWL